MLGQDMLSLMKFAIIWKNIKILKHYKMTLSIHTASPSIIGLRKCPGSCTLISQLFLCVGEARDAVVLVVVITCFGTTQ